MTILVPPRADPNIACAVEGFSLSNTISGTKQVMTVTIATPSEAAGTVKFTVTAANMDNSPKAVDVVVADEDTVEEVAALVAAAFAADANVGAFFDITAAGAVVTLTRKTHAANDATMALAVKTDANTGVTVTSAITVQGALATSCTITVTPEVEYAAIPVLVGAPQHVKSDGSAATKIDSWAITTQATTGVTITVTLDAAPGAGITDTIVFNGGLIGIPAR